MIEGDRAAAADEADGWPEPGYVSVESLSRRPRRRFVLPCEVLPDGVVRFIDSRDEGRLDRVMRRGFTAFVWMVALLWFGGAAAVAMYGMPGAPLFILGSFLSLGLVFAAAGEWMRRDGRPRTVEIDVHGRARISGPGAGQGAGSAAPWREASLELRPFAIYADRGALEGHALLIRAGRHRVMLCAGDSRAECIAALESMPAQVGSLSVHDSDRPIIGSPLVTRQALEKLTSSDPRRH